MEGSGWKVDMNMMVTVVDIWGDIAGMEGKARIACLDLTQLHLRQRGRDERAGVKEIDIMGQDMIVAGLRRCQALGRRIWVCQMSLPSKEDE